MSQRAIAYVQSLETFLTEGEYAVAMALALLARDADDVAEATMVRIGELAGVQARRARFTIRALDSYGLLIQVYQQKGLRRARTTYTFVELEEERPKPPRDLAQVISLAKAATRKARAMRDRSEAQQSRQRASYRDPLLLATVYEEMAQALRAEAAQAAQAAHSTSTGA